MQQTAKLTTEYFWCYGFIVWAAYFQNTYVHCRQVYTDWWTDRCKKENAELI